jgi:hypothetical protein
MLNDSVLNNSSSLYGVANMTLGLNTSDGQLPRSKTYSHTPEHLLKQMEHTNPAEYNEYLKRKQEAE